MKKEITFIRDTGLSPFEIKIARALKKSGYIINSVTFHEIKKEYKNIFNENIYFMGQEQRDYGKLKKLFYLPKFIFSLRRIRKNVLIGVTSTSNWFVAFIFWFMKKKVESIIYFPYDIAFFRFKNYKKYKFCDRFSEKYNFKHCDGVIHKGPEDEFKFLPKSFQVHKKSSIQFLPYCDDDLIVKIDNDYFDRKLSKKDGKIHLVYIGGVYQNDFLHYDTIEIFREIIKQNLCLHVYPINYQQLKNDPVYIELQKNKYFYLHKPIFNKELQKNLSIYDWGIEIFRLNYNKINKIWGKTAYSNKISTYLESSLPIIINEELEFILNIIKKLNVGIIVKDIKDIRNKITIIDYEMLVKNIIETRKEFSIQKNLLYLELFIKNCVDKK